MSRHSRLPSPAVVIAMVALFAALGGTSFAATKVVASTHKDKKADTKLIKKLAPTLSVEHATTADTATSATSAATAANATNASNATNAAKVGGYLPNDLARGDSGTGIVNASAAVSNAVITGVNAPKAGGLLIEVDLSCASFGGSTNTRWNWWAQVDGSDVGAEQVLFFPHADVSSQVGASGSTSVFVPLTAGAHTVGYRATPQTGDGSLDCDTSASSLFVPFDNSGSAASLPRADAPSRHAGGVNPR